jgi:hypothetical protein
MTNPMTFEQELKPGWDGIAITMLPIPAGSFLMGSPESEPDRFDDEGPQHQVTLRAFWMAQTPTTQAQWRTVAGWPKVERDLEPDPSCFKGDQRPVEMVSWRDAQEFCRRLSQRTGKRYGLPSEAQWEYACRAGSSTPFYFGATLTPEQANYNDSETVDVASYPANAWGLHDMHGNVWEWCQDHWHSDYEGAPNDGSAWEDCSLGKSKDCCAAGRGTTTPRTAVRPAASASSRSTATTTSVSASVASPRTNSLPFCPLILCLWIMTTPKPLSPAAQKLKDAVIAAFWDQYRNLSASPDVVAAAAIRAAAPLMQFVQDHRKLLAIATELEGSNG